MAIPTASYDPMTARAAQPVRVVLLAPFLASLVGHVVEGDAHGLYLIDVRTIEGDQMGVAYVPWTSVAYVYPEPGERDDGA